jgi:3-hydroxyisobutyrate dehydrogenase
MSAKLKVGFVGLGIMGGPMARNVLKAGFEVTVHNRTPAKAKALAAEGAKVAATPAQVAAACDVTLVCVTDTPDVLEVILNGQDSVLAGVKPGAIVVDHSTVSPAVAKQCAQQLGAKGASFLDAPVSGGDIGAKNATLSIMVGGHKEDFDKVLPVFQAMGKTVTYCGPHGSGYIVKLCNQILGALHLVAASEALVLADAAGIDKSAMLAAVSGGAAGSWIISNLAPKMAKGDFAPGFFVDYQLKDLHIAANAAHDLGTPLPGMALAEQLFRAASRQGFGKEGTQAMYKVIRALGNR